MKLTTNYSLKKPDLKDKVNINDLNSNVDKIDEELKKVNDSLKNNVSNLTSQLKTIETEKTSKVYVDTKIGNMGNTKTFKGSCLYSALPASAMVDDYWYITDKTTNYCWNGSVWVDIGNNLKIGDKTITQDKMLVPYVEAKLKNLFNKSKVVKGGYIEYSTGIYRTNVDYCYLYVEVMEGEQYRVSGTIEQCAYFNSNKSYVSGLIYASSVDVIPTGVKYLCINCKLTELDKVQVEKGSVVTTYEASQYSIKNESIAIDNIEYIDSKLAIETKFNNYVEKNNLIKGYKSANLFNKDKVTTGYYIEYSTGIFRANGDYSVSEYIELEAGTYTLKNEQQQLCIFNTNKKYKSGIAVPNKTFELTEKSFVRISVKNSFLDKCMLLKDDVDDNVYIPYGTFLEVNSIYDKSITIEKISDDLSNVIGARKIITLKKSGGDCSSLRSAIESLVDSNYNYEIHIYEGEYNVLADYTDEEKLNSSFIGLKIPKNVRLIGIGDPEKIILRGEVANTFNSARAMKISTLNLYYGSSQIENITVVAKNIQYAVHNDWYGQNGYHYAKGCIFKMENGNIGNAVSYGMGSFTGMKFVFDDCSFILEKANGMPLYMHNNTNFTSKSKFIFNRCKFYNKIGDLIIQIDSLGSNVKDVCEFNNCELNGKIYVNGTDFNIIGGGNSITPYSGVGHTKFNEETVRIKTKETLNAYNLVKLSPYYNVNKLTTSDDKLYFGITLEKCNSGDYAVIKRKGYILLSLLGLSGSNGNTVGVKNGVLVVNDGNKIGTIVLGEYLLLD